MESEQRGRASRASSTSSLGREVRCGCQYYQSDSLLPERRALLGRPLSRTMQQPPAVRCSEHEYEPIAAPSPSPKLAVAPVVRITDTDVVPVADSDDSIDDRGRLPLELTRAGDVVLPLDGKIEDTAMEARELVETGDTSEEQETPQQFQEQFEERFLSAPTPGTESRTDGEVNTSQVDSLALEELPLRRGARGLPQKLKTQAGKLRSRLRNIQRPTFAFAERQKSEKPRSTSSGHSDRSRGEKRPSRMDRIRSSISDRSRFSLANRPRFSLPDRSKFHLPERPKFHLPERPKFNIKKPNIRLPASLTRAKKSPVHDQRSTDSTIGSSTRRNIFDFSTYPRIFDKKSKIRGEYATSTPKDSRAHSAESSTFPRARKGEVANERWAQRYEDAVEYIDEDRSDAEPKLATEEGGLDEVPWEEKRRQEQLRYTDYEHESTETSDRQAQPRSDASRTEEESYEREQMELEPRLYGERDARDGEETEEDREDWMPEKQMAREDFRPVQRSRSLEEVLRARDEKRYDDSFAIVDPRRYGVHKTPSEEEEEEYEEEMDEEEEAEPSSAQSDREQQHSSASSCDRRRRGVIEEIDSDEFFLRESGLSQDDANLGKYLTHEIRDALRSSEVANALADDDMVPIPPQRPTRKRALRNQKQDSSESYDLVPPVRPKRDPARARRSESMDEQFRERTRSDSRHRVVYQTEGAPPDFPREPLDDIVVVKPMRRKSRSSQRSQSQETPRPPSPTPPPPVVPTRRKRLRKGTPTERRNGEVAPICNGHTEWPDSAPEKPLPLPPTNLEQLPDDREAFTAEEIMAVSEENLQKRLQDEEYIEPAPIPPKRRSRSRGTSVAQDDDRTSHGAESLPEAGYAEEDIPPDDADFDRDLSGYAIIEKREKPPRPPPPRRKRDKFATAPRPLPPKRPQRAYSTLGPGKVRETVILTETFVTSLEPADSTPYVEIDSDDGEHKDLRSSEVLTKMQGRPLPAPPRPPRARKDRSLDRSVPIEQELDQELDQELAQEFSMQEATTATQTDPLPDDVVIEEEVTQAKLIVTPSRSGSQIMISTERIPTPSSIPTPPVPPLPVSQRPRREDQLEPAYDTVSLKSPSPTREIESLEDRHMSAPQLEEPRQEEDSRPRSLRSAPTSDEPVRIGNLEVRDLRVDRLSVSQIEASKIVASEVDALIIAASELKHSGGVAEESLSPSIIRELVAIRSHLEIVALARAEERKTIEEERQTDIPIRESDSDEKRAREEQTEAPRQSSAADERSMPAKEEQKVVKVTEPTDREIPKQTVHTLTVARVELEEPPLTHTLSISQVELSDRDIPSTQHSSQLVRATEDSSLRILDSENPLSLSPAIAKEPATEESFTIIPSVTEEEIIAEPRLSPERASETIDEQPGTLESKQPVEFSSLAAEPKEEAEESSLEGAERKPKRKSRSRSPSPIGIARTRQTASPVRSLPPAISVTPDTPDSVASHVASELQPQRAVISYSSYTETYDRESQRESSQSPLPSFPLGGTHLIAFPASQVPPQFLSLSAQPGQRFDPDPSVVESIRQLLRVLRLAGVKAMRHFIGYVSSVMGGEDAREKIREVELTLCALLLLIVGLLIFLFSNARTVTHHHHWDYFNPPK